MAMPGEEVGSRVAAKLARGNKGRRRKLGTLVREEARRRDPYLLINFVV
jgi:hypothetical protein